jgi:hypothetical protein
VLVLGEGGGQADRPGHCMRTLQRRDDACNCTFIRSDLRQM